MYRICAFAVVLACTQSVAAQDASATLSIDLNAVEQTETGCLLTFVANNTLATNLEGVVFETVLFDAGGQVTQMTMLDFGPLPVQSTRVRQFNLATQSCAAIGRVLFNGIQSCVGPNLAPETCAMALSVSTRTDIEVSR